MIHDHWADDDHENDKEDTMHCHEETTHNHELTPCNKPAVAMKRSQLIREPAYPVCKHHTRGDILTLEETQHEQKD